MKKKRVNFGIFFLCNDLKYYNEGWFDDEGNNIISNDEKLTQQEFDLLKEYLE